MPFCLANRSARWHDRPESLTHERTSSERAQRFAMNTKGQKIHTRKIDIATYAGTSDSITVEGILHDQCLMDTYRPAGEICPPGTIHHLMVRMEVRGPD